LVRPASKIEECGSPTMSLETMGSSVYLRMPLRGPSAAALYAALTSATVTGRDAVTVRSVMEPVGTGTRSA
jgi:hypothetical protein